ncbi:MAG: 50S ribosomal protein L9 [Treponema sp.]|jgi:large subunit ribosomal protein L9|nr:50S ribosomal protein L9 [Treponema sp.]
MKVILNKDLSPLGEEGDVKDVARGYARNFLFPRDIAVPYNEKTVKLFESRKGEIEARKAEKRKDAAGLKEKLEALELSVSMPAGANGKLYGAVTSQTVMDELAKQGFQIERKRIELQGTSFKSVGKYKVLVKLYESASAELSITVQGQAEKTETRPAAGRKRRRDEEGARSETQNSGDGAAAGTETAPAETLPPETAPAGTDEAPAAEAPPSPETGGEEGPKDAAGNGENASQA